jgi:chemotaxis protein methyltransferase CheR
MRRRIVGMMDSRKQGNLASFQVWLKDPANMRWFLDKMAINVSELFRNPEKWIDLETKILPELRTRSQKLKCWSAGCSYGAEAHTLAMILAEKFPGSHQVIGTDIDHDALAQANQGSFNQNDMRGVPSAYKKYLKPQGANWVADASLKKFLQFRKENLLESRYEKGFDLILCRNVVIYFTDEAKDQIYERFFDALKPGGIVFVGSTERIFRAREIGYETAIPFFYRKPVGEKEWRKAS